MKYQSKQDHYNVDIFNDNFRELSEKSEGLNRGIFDGSGGSNGGMFQTAVISRTDEYGVEYLEYWFFVNARYDAGEQRFKRIDMNLNSFGIQYQAKGTYPGEAGFGDFVNQAIGYWRSIGRAYFVAAGDQQTADRITEYIGYDDGGKWKEFGTYLGWNNCFMLDSYGGETIGGAGFEIDGNGMFPYSRVSLSKFAGGTREGKNPGEYMFSGMGLLWNAFHQFSASDDSSKDSYFLGMRAPVGLGANGEYDSSNIVKMEDTSAVFMRRRGGGGHCIEDWETVFDVTPDGRLHLMGRELAPPLAVQCEILDSTSFQVPRYPAGYSKVNTLLVACKALLDDATIVNIGSSGITYTDYGILGYYSAVQGKAISKMYAYVQKTEEMRA